MTPLDLPRHPALRVADFPGRGRGLVAGAPIRKGELLEIAPVIPLRREDLGAREKVVIEFGRVVGINPFGRSTFFLLWHGSISSK